MKNKIISIKKLHKKYDKLSILDNLSFDIYEGEIICIVGTSGCGKSTLLNILSGIDRPTKGSVICDGEDITEYNEEQLSEWRGRSMGIVFQFFQLMPTLTVKENIILPMEFVSKYVKSSRKFSVKERDEKAEDIMKTVGIDKLKDKFPSEISGGEQQRTAVARALINDPKLIIADEPTGNLDTETTEQVMKLFEDLKQKGKTILMVTHNNDIAERADRLITVKDGLVLSDERKR